MNRYHAMFRVLGGRGEGAFGAFVMLGDPDLQTSADILDALVEGGADMLEVGIPFSDPVADGPVIQAAGVRALGQGVTPADCFELLKDFRARHPHVPVGLLTYANLVVARGRAAFYGAAAAAGVDSVLVADVPMFEAGPYLAASRDAAVAPVLIIAMELRPGGRFAFDMAGPGGERHPSDNVFLDVVPGERIVSTNAFTAGWQPKGRMDSDCDFPCVTIVTFEPEASGTRYTARVRHWTPEAVKAHEAMGFEPGWNMVTVQLAELAEREAQAKAA